MSDRQNKVEAKMERVEKIVDTIEKDIYVGNEYDVEIVCPYCNYNFVLDPDEMKDEVECPECNNLIEIDWDGESFDECSGSCGSCGHKCGDIYDDEDEQDDIKFKSNNIDPKENDDDM